MGNLLTANQVAKQLAVVPLTVYRLTKLGRLRPLRIGRLLRFEEADVARFLREESARDSGRDSDA